MHNFLQLALGTGPTIMSDSSAFPKDINLLTATIQELQGQLAHGLVTSVQLVENYSVRLELRTVSTDSDMELHLESDQVK